MEKRRRPHQSRACPFPLATIEQASAYKIPDTEEGWAALANVKKLDANDLVHELGPKGFLQRLNEMETHVISWNESEIVSLGALQRAYPKMREPIIHGLLRRSETMNIIAAPKSSKSWLGLNIAMNIIGGGLLFAQFQCERGKVLIVDNELHEETIAERGRFVAPALNVPASRAGRLIDFLPLRGNLTSIEQLGEKLKHVRPRTYNVIILDAFYKFYPVDFDENDNAAMARLYTILDELAERLDAALILIHHSSKGNSSAKSVTDMGAGAGSQSRACDAHLVLREHREPGVFVLEAACRSFKPIEKFCARFSWPEWLNAPSYDPEDLKGLPVKKGDEYGKQRVGKPSDADTHLTKKEAERKRLDEFTLTFTTPVTQSDMLAQGADKKFFPWNHDRLKNLIPCWIKDGHIRIVSEKRGRSPAVYISTKASAVASTPSNQLPQPIDAQYGEPEDPTENEYYEENQSNESL